MTLKYSKKLTGLLSTLDKKGLQSFERFLKSPFHNTDESCTELLSMLTNPTTNKPQVSATKFSKAQYKLISLFEEFIAHSTIKRKDEFQVFKKTQLLKFINAHFDKDLRISQKVIEKSSLLANNELDKYQLNYAYYEYLTLDGASWKVRHQLLSEMVQQVNAFSLADQLALYNTNLSMLKLYSKNLKAQQLLAQLKDELENRLADIQAPFFSADQFLDVRAELLLAKILLYERPVDLAEIEALLQENRNTIAYRHLRVLLPNLQNFYIRKIRTGQVEYYQNLEFNIKWQLEMEVQHQSLVVPQLLRNLIIITGKHLGKLTDGRTYVDTFIPYVIKKNRKSIKNYCLGLLYFYQAEQNPQNKDHALDLAFDHFTEVYQENSEHKYDIRSFFLRIQFLRADDPHFSLKIKNFKELIRRARDLSDSRLAGFLNFATFLNYIYRKMTDPNYRKTKAQIHYQLQKKHPVSNKEWLLKKLEELKE